MKKLVAVLVLSLFACCGRPTEAGAKPSGDAAAAAGGCCDHEQGADAGAGTAAAGEAKGGECCADEGAKAGGCCGACVAPAAAKKPADGKQ